MKKDKSKGFTTKETSFKALDIDEGSRRVKGMLSAFNVIDSDSDVITIGAFAKSIAERGPQSAGNRKISFLWSHDIMKPIGKFLELEETNEGLLFVAEMGRSTTAKDAFLNYQDGIIKEHSIGFRYIYDKLDYIETEEAQKRGYSEGYFEVKEVILYEGSAVIFGANEYTPTLEVAKGETLSSRQADIEKSIKDIAKAIKNGKGTDERLLNLDIFLHQLTAKYNTLLQIASKPNPKESLSQPVKPIADLSFFKNLK